MIADQQLPDTTTHVPCDDCHKPAVYRVLMHPPANTGPNQTCGHHVILLCAGCLTQIVAGIRRTLAGPKVPICTVCEKPFTQVHDIVMEVEKL